MVLALAGCETTHAPDSAPALLQRLRVPALDPIAARGREEIAERPTRTAIITTGVHRVGVDPGIRNFERDLDRFAEQGPSLVR